MLRALIFSISVCITWPCSAGDAELRFKGVELGATPAAFFTKVPDKTCMTLAKPDGNFICMITENIDCRDYREDGSCSEIDKILKRCNRSEDWRSMCAADRALWAYGDARINFMVVEFVDNQLAQITLFFRGGNRLAAIDALNAKFGKPTQVIQIPVQTKTGGQFQNEQSTWSFATGTIVADSLAATVNDGAVRYSYASAMETKRLRNKSTVKEKAAKDL